MITYIGFRKAKASLSGETIVVDGIPQIIDNLKEIEDYQSRTTLVVALSIQTIIVMLIISVVVNLVNYSQRDRLFASIFSLIMIAVAIWVIRYRAKYQAAWIYNDNMSLLIEQTDSASLLSNLHALAQEIARRPGMKSVQCPYCLLRTPPISPGDRACPQCATKFTVEADYSLVNIKKQRFYSILEIASLLTLLMSGILGITTNIIDKLSISFGRQVVLIPIIVLFSSFVGEGLHHGILPARLSPIYRAQNPKLFTVLLLTYAGLVLFILWIYLTMH